MAFQPDVLDVLAVLHMLAWPRTCIYVLACWLCCIANMHASTYVVVGCRPSPSDMCYVFSNAEGVAHELLPILHLFLLHAVVSRCYS